MKSKIFKIVLPAVVFILAIAASFATHAQNGMEEDSMFMTGYVMNAGVSSLACIGIPEVCSTDFTNPICRTSASYFVNGVFIPPGEIIFNISLGTVCVDYLYRPY
ncbi:MAG: DUF6520 family protein [Saonia sp.]